jgi:DAACS family dicarboxylate/amino acid:cation (Na+ or H+) symporter
MLRPGDQLDLPASSMWSQAQAEVLPAGRKIDFVEELTSCIPASVLQPFLEDSVISIMILAVPAGAALRHVENQRRARGGHSYKVVENGVATLYQTIEATLGAAILLVPLAVFGVVARTIGRDGLRALIGLADYVGVAPHGLAIQVFVVYQSWAVLGAQMPLRRF